MVFCYTYYGMRPMAQCGLRECCWLNGIRFRLHTASGEAALAPSLRELLSEREAEGVRYDEWTCTYGFAALTVGEALSLPLRRSRLGSTERGAAERSEAEGFTHC